MRFLILVFILFSLISCDQQVKSTIESTDKEQEINLITPDELYPDLFEEVQMTRVFPDSKTFVDCVAKFDAESINEKYAIGKKSEGYEVTSFVKENFDVPISISSDFKSDSSLTASEHVKSLWPLLTRDADVVNDKSTLIPLPNSYVVPGGRFREVYYWDSYFTMLGLIEHEEFELVENILDNFSYLLETIGHIPNGNRSYYKTRSQPPFFSQMVKIFAEAKGDEIYKKYKTALIKEYDFWMKRGNNFPFEHSVMTDLGIVNRYWDRGTTPRQESYKEDYELVEGAKGGTKMYINLRAGAESGWDYSSRWFADGQNMSTIETTDIIPVDLNSLLYGLERILLDLDEGGTLFAERLQNSMELRKKFITEKCWSPDGSFEDYNYVKNERTGIKSLAMVYPLFFEMVSQEQADQIASTIRNKFLKPGGVVTSLHNTGQQWDAPNGWAPLQWMTIIGLDNYGHKELAKEIAHRWIKINEKVYKNTGKFVEKYNVEDLSLEAGGGEYPVQDGFGWSNGVYLAALKYVNGKSK